MRSKTRTRLAPALLSIGVGCASLSGCALFGSHAESTVAQGQYYASGNAYYDQFFVDLYLLQVGMADAPKVPEAERERLTQLLQLEQQATPAAIELRLHEEALNLSRAGVHLRLDQSSPADGPDAARTVVRSNARPKADPARTLIETVETSSTRLLRFARAMKQNEEALGRLDVMTIRLDAGVDRAFSQAPVGKPSEVKKNLADAHKLIPLMRARSEALRANSEQLLAALTHGIDTDDGSIGPPLAQPAKSESPPEADAGSAPAKKAAAKPHPKGKPATAVASPAASARPKPTATSGDEAEPAKARPAKKPAAPRDFEP